MKNGINKGLLLILKREPDAELSACIEQIYLGNYDSDIYSKEDRKLLKSLSWFEEYNNWSHFT